MAGNRTLVAPESGALLERVRAARLPEDVVEGWPEAAAVELSAADVVVVSWEQLGPARLRALSDRPRPLPRLVVVGEPADASGWSQLLRLQPDHLVPERAGTGELAASLAPPVPALRRAAQAPAPARASLAGQSPLALAARRRIASAASCDLAVVVGGRAGMAQATAARTIHDLSRRAEGPWVSESAAGVDDVEALLEAARGGSLHLDEVAQLPRRAQETLLARLVEDDASPAVAPSVRLLASTSTDLTTLARSRAFSALLAERLGALAIRLPSLAERPQDVPALATALLSTACERLTLPPKRLSAGAMEMLAAREWPGNVAELEHALEQSALGARGRDVLEAGDLVIGDDRVPHPPWTTLPDEGVDLPSVMAATERAMVLAALARTRGNRQQAAMLVGLQRTTLVQKLRRWEET